MFSQVGQIGQAGLTLALRTIGKPTRMKVERYMTANNIIQGLIYDSTLLTSSTPIIGSGKNNPQPKKDPIKVLDESIKMILMKKTITQTPGLMAPRNRDLLVTDFYELTKSVIDSKLSVDDFTSTDTFKQLQNRLEYSIDLMNNSQVVNLLASVIKMKMNPSINLVRLLEHEVRFRIKMFNLNQIIKLFKCYATTEMSSEQKQLAEMLHYRLKAIIQNDESLHINDLIMVLQQIAASQIPNALSSLVEEKLLSLLTLHNETKDDPVMKYLKVSTRFDYNSLCNLIITLAENKRRPTPILKSASIELCRITDSDIEPSLIISTLNALDNLNYPNKQLVGKLMSDLLDNIKFDKVDSNNLCVLLKSISSLRWKSEDLLEMVYKHCQSNIDESKKVDQNVVRTLLYVSALFNYTPKETKINDFYNQYVKKHVEEKISKQSRKWLNYVWSLTALNLADEAHIRSVLNQESLGLNDLSLSFSDKLKLLNLKALSIHEMKYKDIDRISSIDELKIQRGTTMQKMAELVEKTLNSMVDKPEVYFSSNIETKFGFNIDFECCLGKNGDFQPIEKRPFGEMIESGPNTICAIILVPFEDTIANSTSDEVVGHKMIIRRILKCFGYKTIFLNGSQLRISDKESLPEKIKTILMDHMKPGNEISY